MMAHPALLAHRAQFQKRVVELAPGVWTAVGHAASNAHMIEGDASVTIVDTTESTGAAENIRAAFRELSDKPVARIIYTHSHRDHISGGDRRWWRCERNSLGNGCVVANLLRRGCKSRDCRCPGNRR